MVERRVSALWPYAFLVAAAVIVGASVASLPWEFSLLAGIAVITLFALAGLRVVTNPTREAVVREEAESGSGVDERLRLARLAYYAGAATIGLLTIRPALGFTVSDWIFLASLVITALVIVVQRIPAPYLVPRTVTIGVLLFALGGILSSVGAESASGSTLVILRMLYLTLVWFWLGTIVLQTRQHVHTAVWAWVVSAAISSAGAVIQFFYGDVIPGGVVAWGRLTGFTGHPNILGGLAATAFVPALMLAVDSPLRSRRLLASAITCLIATGILLSGSVGGLLASSVATMVWLALRGVSVRMVLGLGAVLASALLLMSATGSTDSPSPVKRIQSVTSEQEATAGTGGSVYTRIEGYELAWSRIMDNPVIGVGLDAESANELLDEHSVHNLILGPWFTAGIFGVLGIVLVVGGTIVIGAQVLRETPARDRSFSAALLAAMVAFVQHGMGEPILYVRYGWFPAALLIALWAQHAREVVPVSRRATELRQVRAQSVRA